MALDLLALRRRRWLYGAAALVLASAVYLLVRPVSATGDEYLTAEVDRGRISTAVTATGTLQAVLTVQVGSQVTGRIQSLHADFNSLVRRGQVIARIDPATYEAALVRARADLEDARAGVATARAALVNQTANRQAALAALQDAERVFRRSRELTEQGVVSERDLEASQAAHDEALARKEQASAQVEAAQAAIEQAEARVKQAEAEVRLAEVSLGYTVIASPVDGVVVSRNVDVGQTVAASLQAPTLFLIAHDLTRMQVVASVDEADIGQLGPDADVTFTVDAFPGEVFQGVIDQIRLNPVVTQNVVTYNVILNVDNPHLKLRPGMTASATFTIAEAADALRLPNAALRFWPSGVPRSRERDLLASSRSAPRERAGGGGETSGAAAPDQGPGGTAPGDGVAAPPGGEVIRFPRIERQRWRPRVVWVLRDGGVPEPRVVRVGLTDGTATQVMEGDLAEGQDVVVGEATLGTAPRSTNNPFSPFRRRTSGSRGGGARS